MDGWFQISTGRWARTPFLHLRAGVGNEGLL